MKFDEVLQHIGEFGHYQKRLYYLICLPQMFGAMQILSVLFTLDIPAHRCSLGENDTYLIQDEHHSYLVNMSIPWETERGRPVLSSCYVYQTPHNGSHRMNETISCNSWVFDKSQYESTVTEKFNIVCDDRILRSHSNMASFAGQLAGAFFMGMLSDVFGRRPIFLLNVLVRVAANITTAFAPNVYVFMVMRLIAALTGIAGFTSSFVLAMEMTGPSRRVFVGIIIEFFWCFGLFALGLIAYFVRNWQTLQLIISVPTVFYFAYIWIIPESPRWLISRGRIPEAQVIIKKIAAANGVDVPPQMLEKITVEEEQKNVRVTQMFTTPSLLIMTLIIFFNWFVVSMVYYGLGLNVQNLSGGIYLNFTIANIMEFASYVVCVFLLDRLGRKILHCSCMLVGGLACIATMFPVMYGTSAIDWVTVLLSMVGKFGVAGAFAIVYVYTAELFPTVVRNSGLGGSSFWARVGGMVSPYIADLGVLIGGDLKIALPLVVFGGMSVAAGLLSLFLPETLRKKLPETIQDAKDLRNAGVGGTGTYICLDYFLQVIDNTDDLNNTVDIFTFVLKLRDCRPFMVQAERQYVFIHDAVKEMIDKKKRMLFGDERTVYQNQGFDLKEECGNVYASVDTDEGQEIYTFV